jgi:uncharacterized protein (TIGR02118 family)
MFKLVILIEPQIDMLKFEQSWPEFLRQAEKMPGLRRESASPVYARLHGNSQVAMIHELYFDSPDDLREALGSPAGQEAGRILQTITGGKFTLLFADHLEDELKKIKEFDPDEENEEEDESG